MYSGAGNVMLMVEIEDRLHNLKQGERSVAEYVHELKGLWADADHYEPIELPHSECVAWVKKWVENKRVLQFLRGLNPEFEGRRATIFHQSTLPSLQEAIAAISQEESRLKVMNKEAASLPSCPIFAATRIKEDRECFNCGDRGHLIRDCPKPLKSARGRGRGSYRGAMRGGRGRGVRSDNRANAATSELEYEASAVKYERGQFKGKLESSEDKDQETCSGDFINFAYTDEGETNREESWDCNQV